MKSETDGDIVNFSNHCQSQETNIQYNNNEEYIGEVKNGCIREGWGIFKYHNGDTYEGDFKNGVREGMGEYIYQDGSIYRGEWYNDMKHGKGTFIVNDKEFQGLWEKDNFIDGIVYEVKNLKMNEQEIDKILIEDIKETKHIRKIVKHLSDIAHSYHTPIKINKPKYRISNIEEFKLEMPISEVTETPEQIKNSHVYKDLKYYEDKYSKYIDDLMDKKITSTNKHEIDIDIRSCNIQSKNMTKTINTILKSKNNNNFHYASCKRPPCLCSTIQNFLWN